MEAFAGFVTAANDCKLDTNSSVYFARGQAVAVLSFQNPLQAAAIPIARARPANIFSQMTLEVVRSILGQQANDLPALAVEIKAGRNLCAAYLALPNREKAILQEKIGDRNLNELLSISQERDPRVFFHDLLAFASARKNDSDYARAAAVFTWLNQSDAKEIPQAVRKRAKLELNAILGKGSVAARFSILFDQGLEDALNPKVIGPMIVASVIGNAIGAFALAKLLGSASEAWFASGMGARVVSGLTEYSAEFSSFALANHALQASSDPSLSDDFWRAGIGIGALKSTGFFGNQLFLKLHGLREFGLPARLPALLRFNQIVIPQGSMFIGMLLAHGLETKLGLRKPMDDATLVTDTLSSMFSLGIGMGIAQRGLGRGFSALQAELKIQAESTEKKAGNTALRPYLLHPLLAPFWAFMGTGGIGGGDGGRGPEGQRFNRILPNKTWRAKTEQGNGIAAGSHRGIGYDQYNEDRYFFENRPDGGSLLVAIDGMGGHVGGEEASTVARDAFATGIQEKLSVPEILALAHRNILTYSREYHPPSPLNGNGRRLPGAVAAAVEIQPHEAGHFTGRFWNVGDAEAVVLRISRQDGSIRVIHHTARPTVDDFERKQNGEPFGKMPDGRIVLEDLFEHRLLDVPVENSLGMTGKLFHYHQAVDLQAGDIVLVGSDGFFENFKSFDLIGKIILAKGAKTTVEIHRALYEETLIRMALLDIANNKELNHSLYSQAYRMALGKWPPADWRGMYEPWNRPNGTRQSYRVYYRGILDNVTGQVVDSLKQDNMTLLVQVLGEGLGQHL